MNCKEFKIWSETATESEIISVQPEILEHTQNCNACRNKLIVLQSAVEYMESQKDIDFSDSQSAELTGILSDLISKNKGNSKTRYLMSRLAVASIIIIGLLFGVIAGSIFSSKANTGNNTWSSEFTLLSGNTDIDAYVFD